MTGGAPPPGPDDTVAVVIVTFNRSELVGRTLDGLAALTRKPDAVYVVDNASSDGTDEVLRARASRGDLPLHVVVSAENLGGAGGFPPAHAGTPGSGSAEEGYATYG